MYGAGWVAAKDLKPDYKLVLQNGECASVGAIRREKLAEPIAVYNFEVKGFHTYYVRSDCVLVHNKWGNDYSSKPAWTNGKRVRDVLAGKPFDVQQKFGKYIVKNLVEERI